MQRLPHRVTIQKRVESKNDFSESVYEWQDLHSCIYAKVTNKTGSEKYKNDQINNFVAVFVRIRKRPGIASSMRVIHGERKLGIKAVLPTQDGVYIDLQCEEWVDG